MQGLVLQLTRVGFLLLLWLFIWSVLRILRTDIYAPTGAVMVRRGLALRGSLLPSRQKRHIARTLVVSDGAVEKHVRNIFTKLMLPPDDEQHRRVMAVLTYLRG